jgi:hypothetical protein
MVQRESPEGTLELVAIDDLARAIDHHRFVNRQQPDVRRPAAGLPALGVAGAHEEPIRPGLEAGRVTKLGKVLPDAEQRLLRRVLGQIDVAQNSMRHRQEPIRDGIDQVGECLLVSALCTGHEIGVHVPFQGLHVGSDRRYNPYEPNKTCFFSIGLVSARRAGARTPLRGTISSPGHRDPEHEDT